MPPPRQHAVGPHTWVVRRHGGGGRRHVRRQAACASCRIPSPDQPAARPPEFVPNSDSRSQQHGAPRALPWRHSCIGLVIADDFQQLHTKPPSPPPPPSHPRRCCRPTGGRGAGHAAGGDEAPHGRCGCMMDRLLLLGAGGQLGHYCSRTCCRYPCTPSWALWCRDVGPGCSPLLPVVSAGRVA